MTGYDCLIVGGGVIGLSLAYELACHGLQVGVLERGSVGSEASWAGAGILPPAARGEQAPPEERLRELANALHAAWSEQLFSEIGIDNGYRVCGGLYLCPPADDPDSLAEAASQWREQGICVEQLSLDDLAQLEPAICGSAAKAESSLTAVYLPDEAQLRNPRHLKALHAACVRRGVRVHEATEVHDFVVDGSRVRGVRTAAGALAAESFCIATGAWTELLSSRLGLRLPVEPIRGQIALLHDEPGRLRHVINVGRSYLVPRPDGRILVGSTEERAGFDKRPTAEAIAGLLSFALELVPSLGTARLERTWAGLRPCSIDGLPYLGQLPGLENAFVAAGHFRSGLQLSTATAVILGRLIRGQEVDIDLTPFSPARVPSASAPVEIAN